MKTADSNWLYWWHMLIGTGYSTQPLKMYRDLLKSKHVQICRITSFPVRDNNQIPAFIKNRNSWICSPSFNKRNAVGKQCERAALYIRAGKSSCSFSLNL